MNKTSIEWTHWSCNALKMQMPDGTLLNTCIHKSGGCANCYAEAIVRRWWKKELWGEFPGYIPALLKMGKPVLVEKELEAVLRLSQRIATGKADPTINRIFWHDMTDEYLDFWPDELLDRVWAVRALTPNLIHQVLTKRAERAHAYCSDKDKLADGIANAWCGFVGGAMMTHQGVEAWCAKHGISRAERERRNDIRCEYYNKRDVWVFPNVHLGVSCEDQKTTDERIPWLLKTPAAVRWVSFEPALGPVDFAEFAHSGDVCDRCGRDYGFSGERGGGFNAECVHCGSTCYTTDDSIVSLDWIVCGGESGPGARPFDIQWARDVKAQCEAAGVPFFMKQVGTRPFIRRDLWHNDQSIKAFDGDPAAPQGTVRLLLKDKKGGLISEWPTDLQIRDYPSMKTGDP